MSVCPQSPKVSWAAFFLGGGGEGEGLICVASKHNFGHQHQWQLHIDILTIPSVTFIFYCESTILGWDVLNLSCYVLFMQVLVISGFMHAFGRNLLLKRKKMMF